MRNPSVSDVENPTGHHGGKGRTPECLPQIGRAQRGTPVAINNAGQSQAALGDAERRGNSDCAPA